MIGITMGCPAGIGPEIILRYFSAKTAGAQNIPVVLGDLGILEKCSRDLALDVPCISWKPGTPLPSDALPVITLSALNPEALHWGHPTRDTALAMVSYIHEAVHLIEQGVLDGMATCPISKSAMQTAGHLYPGHTEMLAELTGTQDYAMMMAGNRLRVTLVTIHCPFRQVADILSRQSIAKLIRITHKALVRDFAIHTPRIAVAALNPHAGENGLFGDEEALIIGPAISEARDHGIIVDGPFPPDTVFFKAAAGNYDAVVCMYHDQGLIPFKLLHFSDGVNVTLGLPIVRTSVDHGTAYDIAGRGVADSASLVAAVELAGKICYNRQMDSNCRHNEIDL